LRTVGLRDFVLDVCELAFLDSSGLHLLDTANTGAREDGMEFMLIERPPQIQRVFELTGLLDALAFGTP
jgi:anti-anti-sigma factor